MFRKKIGVYKSGNILKSRSLFLANRQAEIVAIVTAFITKGSANTATDRTNAIQALSAIEQKIIDFFVEFELDPQ
jgi:hypothetical protein